MNRRYVETKVLAQHGPSTHLLIKAGDTVVQANYAEVAPCAFPVWTGAPVYVEIPAHGVKNSVPGSFSRAPEPQDASGELPNIIKFPVYTHQEETALQEFEDLAGPSGRSNGATGPGSRLPVVAIAAAAGALMNDDRRIETHRVLPVWNDGTAVLVSLDWCEGEPAEGTPNPEWHLRASNGLPLDLGLRHLAESAQLPAQAADSRYCLTVSPWKLGAAVLGSPGHETAHKIWQREWRYDDLEEFRSALGRLRDALLGLTADLPSMAEQRA